MKVVLPWMRATPRPSWSMLWMVAVCMVWGVDRLRLPESGIGVSGSLCRLFVVAHLGRSFFLAGDAVAFVCPGAQVDHFAALAAEGAVGAVFVPEYGFLAGGAGYGGLGHGLSAMGSKLHILSWKGMSVSICFPRGLSWVAWVKRMWVKYLLAEISGRV